jgi:hypothetical protein
MKQSIGYGPQAKKYLAGPIFCYFDSEAIYLWTSRGEYTIPYSPEAPELALGLLIEHIKRGIANRVEVARTTPTPAVEIDDIILDLGI